MELDKDEISVILNAYKRDYFELQIDAILNQTKKPKNIYLWQNENHIDISYIRKKYLDDDGNPLIKIINSDENMKFHGRFVLALLMHTEYIAIFDDDIIPGKLWLENCLKLSKEKNCIVGANSRDIIPDKIGKTTNPWLGYDFNIQENYKVHLVGHCWFLKKEWLKYMWMLDPYTLDNAEDMHLCITCKLYGNIDTYVAQQRHKTHLDECADTTLNKLGTDKHASFIIGGDNYSNIRIKTIQYLMDNGWNPPDNSDQ
jgi:hypothetical protein